MRHRPALFRPLSLLRSLIADRRGISAVTVAISLAVLAPMALGVFDVFSMTEQRGKLQDALDAAALYAARSPVFDTPSVNTVGTKAFNANLQLIHGATLQGASFSLQSNKVIADAAVQLQAYAPMEFTHQPVTVHSEVTRAGNNLEVALVLDNSTSMAGASLTSLKAAAGQLVDLVVSDTQTPFYSKVAIIPYAAGVNVGAYATAARGPIKSPAGTNPTAGTNTSPPSANFLFLNEQSGAQRTLAVSTCVSERTGVHAYDDVGPTSAFPNTYVGLNYPDPTYSNPCIPATMAPLSSDKTALHTSINNLTACCSTGGQVGVAWGWYTLSPNWSGVFTGNSAPASYTAPQTIKAVVLMTDGEYNSVYCNGVIAKAGTHSSSSGYGDPRGHINCLGTNGKDPYEQAKTLCAAMKAAPSNIVIYTVGLNLVSAPAALDLVQSCATDAHHVYLPANGTALQVAFQAIASDLNRLRISH